MLTRRLHWIAFIALWSCVDGSPQEGVGPEDCANHADDNGDGKVDCLDPKCFADPLCTAGFEICDNQLDDNGDGKIDCDDALCAGQACGSQCTCVSTLMKTDGGVDAGADGGASKTDAGSMADAGQLSFVFADVTNATPLSPVTSNAVTLGIFSGPLTLSCTGCTHVGKNDQFLGPTVAGVMPGDRIAVRATAGPYASKVMVTVTLGAISTVWSITSRSASYAWNAGAWSTCNNTCGAGTQTRTVTCQRDDGMAQPDSQCTDTKPVQVQTCTGSSGCGGGPCALPWGGSIDAGTSVQAYQNKYGSQAAPCESANASQLRTCTNGVLSGSFTNPSCANYPCAESGAFLMDGAVGYLTPFSSETVAAPHCANGIFAGSALQSFTGPTKQPPCQLNNWWYDEGTCGVANGLRYRCTLGAWAESTNCPQAP